jgi:serine protease Do
VLMTGLLIVRRWRPVLTLIPLLSFMSLAPPMAFADGEHDPIAAMVAKVSPAVVRVITVRPLPPAETKSLTTVASNTPGERTSTALGSGFIIDPAGFIATNKHVVEGAISVFVVTTSGVRYPATIVGMAGKVDMALLRIDAGHDLPFLRFGDSDKMLPGDRVIAIGSPFGFDTSVSTGIISAVNRDIMESPFDAYIQTDAAINHGNSGGPLFNMSGEVIGMTSVIFSPDPASAGVGFAEPSNDLQFVFDRLMKTGAIRAGMLPIRTQHVTWMLQQAIGAPDLEGAMVASLLSNGDARLQGKIVPGDVIRAFNGEQVLSPRDLTRKVARAAPGSDVVLGIYRSGAISPVHVTIGAWPEAQPVVLDNDGPRKLGLELGSGRDENGKPIVTVTSIDPTGTAASSEIRKNDIILEIQQIPVSEVDQAERILQARSSMQRHFAAVLVQRDGKIFWMSLAVPELNDQRGG